MSGSSRASSTQHFIIDEIRSQQASRDKALLQLLRSQICLRRVTLSFNLFFWITGPGLVGLGIWLYLSLSEFQPIVERQDFTGPAYLILVAGGAAVLSGIVGCLGGVNEHKHLLLLYSILVMIVCSLELSATVYTFTEFDKARSTIRSSFERALVSYNEDEATQMGVDKVQRQFSCCGIERPIDWVTNQTGNRNTAAAAVVDFSEESALTYDLPISCCPRNLIGQGQCTLRATDLYQQGCLQHVLDWVRHILVVAGWSSFAAACSQVLGLAIVCCFTSAVNHFHI
ncbi:hypothetical protein RRG08_008535 [Elysia crispata]|uniref:Tetraspanin n=1 Tax=Elysia crispata TaxID=231223 RepID=A0AAE0YEG9_9GAST|nr:hypothetical protein RRG08_008535 [Elysia crispata]